MAEPAGNTIEHVAAVREPMKGGPGIVVECHVDRTPGSE